MPTTFFDRLQLVVALKKISQKGLSEMIGVDQGTVSRWKRKPPSVANIVKICEVLGCDFNWLNYGNGEPFPPASADQGHGNIGRVTSGMAAKPENVVMTIEPGPARKKGSKTEEQQARQETEAIDEDEAIEQTRYVLRSDTVYRGALVSNIRAFYQGVRREEEMAGVDEQMIEMQNKMDMMMQMLESLGAHLPSKKRDAQEG